MISDYTSNQVQTPAVAKSQGMLRLKERLRQWWENPLAFVFMVWGILFTVAGLLWIFWP